MQNTMHRKNPSQAQTHVRSTQMSDVNNTSKRKTTNGEECFLAKT